MGNVNFSHSMIQGEAVSTIAETANKMGADYIVMGTKGATGLKEVFLGSVTSGVMEFTKVPVLSIPDDVSYKDVIKKVVYLTNYQSGEVKGFKQAVDFANIFSSKLICLHLNVNEEVESKEQMEKWRSLVDGSNVEFVVE